MHLVHVSQGDIKDILNILKGGKLLSSKKTGNVKLHGWATDYIFFSLEDVKEGFILPESGVVRLYFKPEMLSDKTWYFKAEWSGDFLKKGIKIDCSRRKCSRKALGKIFEVLYKKIWKGIKKRDNKTKKDTLYPEEFVYSHEILIKGEAQLQPYLYKVGVHSKFPGKEKIKAMIKRDYEDVEFELF